VARGLALAVPGHPVCIAVAPALLLGPVKASLNSLDLARVVLDVQRCRADAGVRVFLEPLYFTAEALVERESRAIRADAVQCRDPGLRVGRSEPGERDTRIESGLAPP